MQTYPLPIYEYEIRVFTIQQMYGVDVNQLELEIKHQSEQGYKVQTATNLGKSLLIIFERLIGYNEVEVLRMEQQEQEKGVENV